MIIQSKFKDYYDWVAKRYGGGDPRIVYERGPIGYREYKPHLYSSSANPLSRILHDPFSISDLRRDKTFAIYVVIAGKAFLALHPYQLTAPSLNDYRLAPLDFFTRNRRRWSRAESLKLGYEYPAIVELCRIVGHPVFACSVDWHRGLLIREMCPILGNIGLPSIIPPEQMYQELAYFVGNLMRHVPDIQPPVEVNNKQKILKAGFDPVISFRHRKNA